MTLAVYATQETFSAGRLHDEPSTGSYRTEYQRDRERIVQSTAFRRLQYKMQTFINHETEELSTRLTHTLEVAQLSRIISRALRLNEDLVEAIALAQDLGHTPFGRAGREALQKCMRNYGGFEQPVQSLRVVDELEEKYPSFRGLNLTFETREGILKDCPAKVAKSLGTVAARFLNEKQIAPPSLEAQVVHVCDNIVHNHHYLDDSLRARLISIRQLRENRLFNDHYTAILKQFPLLSQRRVIYETIRRMVNEQVANVIETSHAHLEALQPKNVDAVRMAEEYMIMFSAAMYEKHLELQQFLHTQVHQHYRVQRMVLRAHQIILHLFDTFNHDPHLLPLEAQLEVQRVQAQLGSDVGRARAVADYIASMTDRCVIAEYEQLMNPNRLLQ